MSNIRIIVGRWRGRKIQLAKNSMLRPTPDRVRETLFNWLMPFINDLNYFLPRKGYKFLL